MVHGDHTVLRLLAMAVIVQKIVILENCFSAAGAPGFKVSFSCVSSHCIKGDLTILILARNRLVLVWDLSGQSLFV